MFLALVPLVACDTTNDVVVELAPDTISSLSGTANVRATALSGDETMSGQSVTLSVAYTDRNGTAHTIADITGKTNDAGVFETQLTGLTWDGTGTVTATVKDGGKSVDGIATFAVLDRTPPAVTIEPPPNNQVSKAGATRVTVHVTDEIGISAVSFASNNGLARARSAFASGTTDTMVDFDLNLNDSNVGQTLTLYALGADLSGNQGAAAPIMVTVIP
jgi:hypothetical protein